MVKEAMQSFRQPLSAGKQVAFVVRKDALWYENKRTFQNDATLGREEALRNALSRMREADGPAFLEIRCSLGARKDLGRPDTTPQENKAAFMEAL